MLKRSFTPKSLLALFALAALPIVAHVPTALGADDYCHVTPDLFADQDAPSQKTPRIVPPRDEIVIEGAGDVTERFYIPALKELAKANKFEATFCDFSNPNATPAAEEKRLRIKNEIESAGFRYLDKRLPEDKAVYDKLHADVVVFAVPGVLHADLEKNWRGRPNPPEQVFLEKPVADSLNGVMNLMERIKPFDDGVMALDHYRPKLNRTREHVKADIKFLGGLKKFEFIMTEDRSGSDANANIKGNNGRDGAIEREGRVGVMSPGVAADLLPHMFADLEYFGIASTARPVNVWAGRYRGVDGDPNKTTEIPKETFFAADFAFKDRQNHIVEGRTIVGKGIRTRSYGNAGGSETKQLILFGRNGNFIVYDLRSSGPGSSTASYYQDGKVVHETKLEPNPYKAFFAAVISGQSITNGHSVHIEEAYAFRLGVANFTRDIGLGNEIPTYDGGMGGAINRPAPYVEDLMATLPVIYGPKATWPKAKSVLEAQNPPRVAPPTSTTPPAPKLPTGVTADRDFWMIGGTGVMGKGFTHRLSTVAGLKVVVTDPNPKAKEILATMGEGADIFLAPDAPTAIASLKRPRKMMLLVPNDAILAKVLGQLEEYLEPGDIIIDGGNSNWVTTEAHQKRLQAKGIKLIGMGVSGGERGAWNGSAMMASGEADAWKEVQPILDKIAGTIIDLDDSTKTTPSAARVGPGGAGHFVKMAHNGIEYAEMQLMAEAYDLLRKLGGLSVEQVRTLFDQWDHTELHTFLLTATTTVLGRIDPKTGKPLVEMVTPVVEQKGTGKWATQNALDMGTYAPTLSESVFERFASELFYSRTKYDSFRGGTAKPKQLSAQEFETLLKELPRALLAARILVYSQGLGLIHSASAKSFGGQVDLAETTRVWRTGSILQGHLLDKIHRAYTENKSLEGIIDHPEFQKQLVELEGSLRYVVHVIAGMNGMRVPAFSSTLNYFDAYRTAGEGPANVLSAVRDYFGAHTFSRIDDPAPAPGQPVIKHHDSWENEQK